jgi:hypothetical protein
MQHGLVIADGDAFFGHLLAPGHHDHQLDFSGRLAIRDAAEAAVYRERRKRNAEEKGPYFLFQAQKLNLPLTAPGQVLRGHIVEAPIGGYTPRKVIVREATVEVTDVRPNVVNPFFIE